MLQMPAAPVSMPFTHAGIAYRAALDPRRRHPLGVYRGGRLIAEIANRDWQPWRLDVGDVDGDGFPEVAVGLNKRTRNLPERHTTVFFYTFDGKRLSKKWLGSTMGRPLLDFRLGPAGAKGSDLFTLQRTLDGRTALNRYRWSGFGFFKEGLDKIVETGSRLDRYNGKIAIVANGKRVVVDSGGPQ